MEQKQQTRQQFAGTFSIDDIESEREAMIIQLSSTQQELKVSRDHCIELEKTVNLLTSKNSKLELDLSSLQKEVEDLKARLAAMPVSTRETLKPQGNVSFGTAPPVAWDPDDEKPVDFEAWKRTGSAIPQASARPYEDAGQVRKSLVVNSRSTMNPRTSETPSFRRAGEWDEEHKSKRILAAQSMICIGSSQRKSTISLLSEARQQRREDSVAVFSVEDNTSFDDENMSEFTQSIVFPQHTLQRINEERGDINATLKTIRKVRMAEDESEDRLDPSESQVFMVGEESAYCPLKTVPALFPKLFQHEAYVNSELPRRSKQLFEDFLVIDDSSSILWQFRGSEGDASSLVRMKSVKDFCFPKGAVFDKETNTFVFTLNGLDQHGKRVHEGNRAGWIFCICLRISPKILLCITTYYEFFDFFLKVLHQIRGSLSAKNEPTEECGIMLKNLFKTDMGSVHEISAGPSSVPYRIPKQSQGLDSALFFCGPLFSALRARDFFELMCHILLEHSVVFVSQNLTLLTSSILGCCSFLHPFKWEHVMIPIVPDMCLEVLEAPVPFIVGVTMPVSRGMTFTTDKWCQHTVIVLLDQGKIFACRPAYMGNQAEMKELPKLAGVETGLESSFREFPKGALAYSPTKAQIEAITHAHHGMRTAFEKLVLEKLPKLDSKRTSVVDQKALAKELADSADPADKEFVGLFCETQMFASQLEERYSTNK